MGDLKFEIWILDFVIWILDFVKGGGERG